MTISEPDAGYVLDCSTDIGILVGPCCSSF